MEANEKKNLRTRTPESPNAREDARLVAKAVIGIVDIVDSTSISNAVDVRRDWSLKHAFFASATRRAKEAGVSILNHTGDGFVFMIDIDSRPDWPAALSRFHQALVDDFEVIVQHAGLQRIGIATGLRIGVSAGPILLGPAEFGQAFAVGADINLASRLCASAAPDEMVLGANVWELVKDAFEGHSSRETSYSRLKGFEQSVIAIHVRAVRAFLAGALPGHTRRGSPLANDFAATGEAETRPALHPARGRLKLDLEIERLRLIVAPPVAS